MPASPKILELSPGNILGHVLMARIKEAMQVERLETNAKKFYSDINWVIMDYLVSEGYPGAAEEFAQETNLCQTADIESIRERVRIRNAIHAGSIDEAVGLVNEVDPEVSKELFYHRFEMITPSFHAPLISTSGC